MDGFTQDKGAAQLAEHAAAETAVQGLTVHQHDVQRPRGHERLPTEGNHTAGTHSRTSTL